MLLISIVIFVPKGYKSKVFNKGKKCFLNNKLHIFNKVIYYEKNTFFNTIIIEYKCLCFN